MNILKIEPLNFQKALESSSKLYIYFLVCRQISNMTTEILVTGVCVLPLECGQDLEYEERVTLLITL